MSLDDPRTKYKKYCFSDFFMILMIFQVWALGLVREFLPFVLCCPKIFRHQTKKWAETIVRVVGFASNFQEMFIPWVLRFPKVSASSDKFCSQGASKTSKNPGRFPAWCRKIATLVSKNQKWDLFLAKPPTLKCCNSNVRRSYVINLDISNNRICSSLILAQE